MKTKLLILSILLTPTFALAQTGTPPSAGLTPQSPFYFLDRLGEVLRELVAFSPETKIRLQVSYAAERIAEIQIEMAAKDVDAKGLGVAQSRLENHLSKASRLVSEEKSKGRNVDDWEEAIKGEIEVSKRVLEASFEVVKDELENEREALKKELEAARKSNETAREEVLMQKLEDLEQEKDRLEDERETQKQSLEDEKERLDDDEEDDDFEDELEDMEDDLDEIKN